MKERYWEPVGKSINDILNDWVSENVEVALAELMKQSGAWVDNIDGKLIVTFHSFEMPTKEGELQDIWHAEFDLLSMVMSWADDYDDGYELSAIQMEDLETRVKLLDELAAKFRLKVSRKATGLRCNMNTFLP